MSIRSQLGRVSRQVGPNRGTSQSASKQVALLKGARAIDPEYYRAQLSTDIGDTELHAIKHYLARGYRRDVSPHPLIEPTCLEKNEPATAGALIRRLRRRRNLRDPHPLIDLTQWVTWHPASYEHKFGPLGHLLATVEPDTVLPTHRRWDLDGITYRDFRDHMLGVVDDIGRYKRRARGRITATFAAGEHVQRLNSLRQIADGLTPPPVVSIVMPVFNRHNQVAAAIESVQSQTWRHWKLIVVDDGSTDESAEVVSSLAAADSRIELIRSAHLGVSAARNQGIDRASSELVAFLDSDNVWRPEFLRTMVGGLANTSSCGAYGVLRLVENGVQGFRAYTGDFDAMFEGAFLDLNVLVCRRDSLVRVGGFDTSLVRMVDYDLALRLIENGTIDLIPVVGVEYDSSDGQQDRISVRESVLWGDVVRRRHLRVPSEITSTSSVPSAQIAVVISASNSFELTTRAVLDALPGAAAEGDPSTEVCVVSAGLWPQANRQLQACFGLHKGVTIVTWHVEFAQSLIVEAGMRATSAEKLLFLAAGASVPPSARRALAESMGQALNEAASVAVAAPILLAHNDQMVDAGLTWLGSDPLPYPTLAAHPVEDLCGDSNSREVPAISNSAFMVTRETLKEMDGLEPLIGDVLGVADLCLRLRGKGAKTLLLTHEFGHLTEDTSKYAARARRRDSVDHALRDLAGAAEFRRRWTGSHPEPSASAWTRAGLDVAAISPGPLPSQPKSSLPVAHSGRRGSPVVVRPDRRVTAGPATGMESLRWSIKIGAPAGRRGDVWGDVAFAADLARSLRNLGQDVVVDRREAFVKETDHLDDVSLLLRGLSPAPANPGRCQVMWVISHPEMVTVAEVQEQDLVFSAGAAWATHMSNLSGMHVEPLLQATNPDRFSPDVASGPINDVLFVGSTRSQFRPIIRDALEAEVNPRIYGPGWDRFVPEEFIVAPQLNSDLLPTYYAAAGIVLNDHWEDMAKWGFVSNRIFDAVAAGARVITDEVSAVEDMFPGSVRVYRDPAHLRELVAERDSHFGSSVQRGFNSDLARTAHSFDQRARTLLDAVERWRSEHPFPDVH